MLTTTTAIPLDARFTEIARPFLDGLTSLSAQGAGSKPTLFQATVARLDSTGHWWLMDRPEDGWSSFGYRYRTVHDLAAAWAVRFAGIGQDEHSRYYVVEPIGGAP